MSSSPTRAGGRARRASIAPADSPLTRTSTDGSNLERLVRERDHWLRSLDELENERVTDELDDDAYAMLRDDYTARIADLQRQMKRGTPERSRTGRRVTTGAAVAVFVVVLAVILSQALGTRTEGAQITGNSPGGATIEELEAAVDENPDAVDARIAYAQALMTNDPFGALKQFDAAAQLAPTNAEVRAYGGWMLYLLAQELTGAEQATAIRGAQTRVADAIAVAPDYPDAYFFSGLIRLRALGDRQGAIADFDRYLALAPNSSMASQVRAARAAAESGP